MAGDQGASKQATQQQQNRQHQQIAFDMVQQQQPSSSTAGSFMNKEAAGHYDIGEFDQALFFYLEGHEHSPVQEQKQTLNIFPSQPMYVEPSTREGGLAMASSTSNASKRPMQQPVELGKPSTANVAGKEDVKPPDKREGLRKGATSGSEHEGPKTPDAKILRRLAQNREAARKSRLRKKAYVQQLEASRIKLAQLEQECQKARAQGVLFGGGLFVEQAPSGGIGGIGSETAMFDMEYGRWLEDHHRLMCDLRAAVSEHLPENELKAYVDSTLAHYDQLMDLKSVLAKSDVFHLVSGMWKTPAERCFLWLGGFRPSDIIKILVSHIQPLTEQQTMAIYALQSSTTGMEDALTQGLETLQHSLSDTVASDELSCPSNMANYMGQMALAMNKLSALEGLVRQADNLRQQMLHRLHQILTTRQAARCFLALAEYFHRLRALSSLWLARPRQD